MHRPSRTARAIFACPPRLGEELVAISCLLFLISCLLLLLLSAPSFWAKGGQHMVALRDGKRPFSVCTSTH
jgi:hypothetical protein